jgi:hypothetical protein
MSAESFLTMVADSFSSDRSAAGVIDLSLFPGRRRLKKRLAKKVLRAAPETYPISWLNAAYKTIRRPTNRANWRAWQEMTDEEKQARKVELLFRMSSVSMAGLYLMTKRVAGAYLTKRGKRRGRR